MTTTTQHVTEANDKYEYDKQGRLKIKKGLQITAVYGCTMQCPHCSHFATHKKGYAPTEKCIAQLKPWADRVLPTTIFLSGGEVFLHPDLENLIKQVKSIFPASGLCLPTNGSMLLKTKDSTFELIKKVHAHIVVSKKQHCQNFRKEYDWQSVLDGIKRLKKLAIKYSIQNSSWRRLWNSPDGYENPVPFNSNAEIANKRCGYERCGLFLHNGNAYNCCFLGAVHESVEMGVLDKEAWALAMQYVPLSANASDDEIMDACASKLIPQCKMCPEICEAF